MIKYSIKKDGVETNSALHPTREIGDAWLQKHIDIGTFRFEDVVIPKLNDELELLPKTHTLEITEDYVDQEIVNTEARQYLAETDWVIIRSLETGIPVPGEIMDSRAAARARVQ